MLTAGESNNVRITVPNVSAAIAGSSSFIPQPIKIEADSEGASAIVPVDTQPDDPNNEESVKQDDESGDAVEDDEANADKENRDNNDQPNEGANAENDPVPGDNNIPTINLLDVSDETGINACAECDAKASKKRAGKNVGLTLFSILFCIHIIYTNGLISFYVLIIYANGFFFYFRKSISITNSSS